VTWLTWRQFRVPALVSLAALLLLAILLAITGVHLHHLYGTYKSQMAACQVSGGNCGSLTDSFLAHYHHLYQYLGTLVVAVPGVIGVFWGPPLLAREVETGTFRLAWTQSVTRTRWLAIKLGLVGAAAIVTAGLLSLMVTWWSSPVDHVNMDRFASEIFSERGLAPIGYAVFAFALGATLGLLIRRTLPAMAVTLVGYVVIHLTFISYLRPHLVPSTHLSLPLTSAGNLGFTASPSGVTTFAASGTNIPNVLVVSSHLVNRAGQTPTTAALHQFLETGCPAIAAGPTAGSGGRAPGNPAVFNACVEKLAAKFHEAVAYIPADRYWELQWLETAAYIALALILAGGCFWWIRHRLT
jgi:hypothetical protein